MVSVRETLAYLDEKERRRSLALDERFAKASEDFARILEIIVKEFRPTRVWQWGSLLDRTRFSDISDIDIAVEGLGSAQRYFDLLKRVDPMTSFSLDVVELERIEPEFATLIRQRGRLVHGDR